MRLPCLQPLRRVALRRSRSTYPWRLGLGLALASSCALVACDDGAAPADDVEIRLASTARPPTEGPWAECRSEDGDTSGWARTICPEPEPDGDERTCSASRVSERQDDGSTWCEITALCNYECATDDDCPQPRSGTVVPVCNSVCSLPCTATSECPDGMTCHHLDHGDTKDAQGFCRYLYVCE